MNVSDQKKTSTSNQVATIEQVIKTIHPGEMFGEQDAMSGRDYTTTVKCSSADGVTFCIEAYEMLSFLGSDA